MVGWTPKDNKDVTDEELAAAEEALKLRLTALNITDYEIYPDASTDSIIVRFPWKEGEVDFDPQAAIAEIGTTSRLVFRKGETVDGELIMEGGNYRSSRSFTQRIKV